MRSWSRSGVLAAAVASLAVASVAEAQPSEPAPSAPPSSSAKPALPALPAVHVARPVSSAPPPKLAVSPPTPAPSVPKKLAAPPSAHATKPVTRPSGKPTPGFIRPTLSRAAASREARLRTTSLSASRRPSSARSIRQSSSSSRLPSPRFGSPWPNELASPLTQRRAPAGPRHGAPSVAAPEPPLRRRRGPRRLVARPPADARFPVRWDARLVRYLEFFKDDPRGRQLFAYWIKRSGRYREAIRRSLRKRRSRRTSPGSRWSRADTTRRRARPPGAGGLWQLTADTAHLYGLSTDRWADQRFNALAETEAAVEMLSDLYRRFGSWELAMAAYNMGYGGVMSVVRRYNTNDYWALVAPRSCAPLGDGPLRSQGRRGRHRRRGTWPSSGSRTSRPDPPSRGTSACPARYVAANAWHRRRAARSRRSRRSTPSFRAGRTPPRAPHWPPAARRELCGQGPGRQGGRRAGDPGELEGRSLAATIATS